MAKATSTQTQKPVIKTKEIDTPEPIKEKSTAVMPTIETEIIEPDEPPVEVQAREAVNIILPADLKKTHKERIISFLEGRRGAGRIKLNDFLKSLYPLLKAGEKPLFTDQRQMKRLKMDLMELRSAGEISFVNDSFERLGKAHFPDHATGKTHYFDITNLIIEVDV